MVQQHATTSLHTPQSSCSLWMFSSQHRKCWRVPQCSSLKVRLAVLDTFLLLVLTSRRESSEDPETTASRDCLNNLNLDACLKKPT